MEDKILEKLKSIGVIWKHSGNPTEQHALLASGKHSDGFINLSILSTHPRVMKEMTTELAHKLDVALESYSSQGQRLSPLVDPKGKWIIGSAMGAITIAAQIAELTNLRAAYTEKTEDGKMSFDRFVSEIGDIEHIFVVEDVMTTGSTTRKTLQALLDADPDLLMKVKNHLGVLINRSGKSEIRFDSDYEGELSWSIQMPIISVADVNFNVWTPEECPLCKKGSKVLKPKKYWNKFRKGFK